MGGKVLNAATALALREVGAPHRERAQIWLDTLKNVRDMVRLIGHRPFRGVVGWTADKPRAAYIWFERRGHRGAQLKHKSVRQNTDEVGGLLHSIKDRDDRTLDASPRTLRGTSAGH